MPINPMCFYLSTERKEGLGIRQGISHSRFIGLHFFHIGIAAVFLVIPFLALSRIICFGTETR